MSLENQPHTFDDHFYDLLSGEFQAVSDPNQRTHTLAQLAVATCTKGNKIQTYDGYTQYRYTPSWAPRLSSAVTTGLPDDKAQVSLTTVDSSNNLLSVWADTNKGHGLFLRSCDAEYPLFYSAQTEESTSALKAMVAAQASYACAVAVITR